MTQPRREFVVWMAIAIAALLAFAVILRLQYSNTQNRWATAVTPKPAQGSAVFRDKGCANCHEGRAGGGQLGPPLRQRAATLPQLVTAMWEGHGTPGTKGGFDEIEAIPLCSAAFCSARVSECHG